jgi:Stress responsive A/B Barrel Domain
MPKVKHVVLFRLRPQTPAEVFAEIMSGLEELRGLLPGLLEVSGGAQNSREGIGPDFTHGFAITFADAATRDAYLAHPKHEPIKQKIIDHLDGGLDAAAVVDWLE